ncbi:MULTISPECIES: nucleotidyltransferase family protein [unclassified Novosphingobium]|uniref:nucleotidyltransferase family protein n=1 Tax=unclassified Novosphingobium TaxID=2644732 RepID=UPI0025E5DACD|nr:MULTISPECIES: nucleotidyltransferase family protein [unclassified Novosphingobium]HQS69952.1 nucleotidyltransferase family protein [Novosphingobium sp.]
MTTPRIAIILLAAGRATRFGGGKLGTTLAGKPLARHAADSLSTLPHVQRIAVCSTQTPDLPGFSRLLLDPPEAPLSHSIAAAVAALGDVDAALFALADMPLVPAAHFAELVARFDGDRIATQVDGRNMVPAIFGKQHFPALAALVGDRGGGELLADAPWVDLPAHLALDIDTPDDLQSAKEQLQGL